MSTGLQKINIFLKKFLTQQQFTTNLIEYLLSSVRDSFAVVFPNEGIFSGAVLSSSVNDTVTISTPLSATDGVGRFLSLDPLFDDSLFENTVAILYYIGLRYQNMPTGTEINVRTSAIKYTFFEEAIGELAEPDAVADDGDQTLTIIVDSVTEAGVSNAGRKVRVWLKTALSTSQTFQELTVVWDGSNNKIETTHALGQTAGSISTTASDYQVMLLGPTIKRNTDLSADPSIVFIGTVLGTGAGTQPTVFDITGQNTIVAPGSVSSLADSAKAFLTGGGLITWTQSTSSLVFAADIKLMMPTRSYDFTISATTIGSFADGEVVYITRDLVGGVKALTKVANGLVPVDINVETIAMRVGNDIYFKNGALELKGDASSPTAGRINDITQDLLNFMGADNESDSDPNYSSIKQITQGQSLTAAIGATDDALFRTLDQPLRLFASLTPDAKINFSASEVEQFNQSGKSVTPLSSQVFTLIASTADFQTGGTTGATFDFALPAGTVGEFRRAGFSLLADGTIKTLFTPEVAVEGNLADPGSVFVSGALPLGWVDIVCTNAGGQYKTIGSATDIIENKTSTTIRVHIFGSGGGSGGGGGGGGGANWVGDALEVEEFFEKVLQFTQDDTQKMTLYVKVPQSYSINSQISMFIGLYSPDITNEVLMQIVTSLVRKGVDAIDSSANQNTADTGDLTLTGPANEYREGLITLTDLAGQINGVAVSPGDLLRTELTREAPSGAEATDDVRFIPSSTEVKFG